MVLSAAFAKLASYGTADIPGPLAIQLVRIIDDGDFKSWDKKHDYRADMAQIRTPTLVVAGRLDRLAPAPAVKDGYRALGGPKEWLMMGQENGATAAYGPMDFIVGERAKDELWPKLLQFLDAQAE